jgi:hypothetical protein
MRIYMQTPVIGNYPPRFYHLILQKELIEGWTIVKESGYQGSPGRVRREHYDDRESAQAALVATRDSLLKRGYRIVFARGQELPA